jgi:hypothetical protein
MLHCTIWVGVKLRVLFRAALLSTRVFHASS